MSVSAIQGSQLGISPTLSSKSFAKQIEQIKKQIEAYQTQLKEVDSKNLSQEVKDAKKKAIEEKIAALQEDIVKLQAEQTKEALKNEEAQKSNSSRKKSDTEKLLESGIALDLSHDLNTLKARMEAINDMDKKFLKNTKDFDNTPHKIFDGSSSGDEISPKSAVFEGTMQENGLIDVDKLDENLREMRTMEKLNNIVGSKKTFLENLVEKTDEAIKSIEQASAEKVGEANEVINETDETKENKELKDELKTNTPEETEEDTTEETDSIVDISV